MKISKVSVIGLGALGVMYAHHLSQHMPEADLRVVADASRIQRYEDEGIYCNGEACSFNFVMPETACGPADLMIFCVKYTQLAEAIHAVRHHIGKDTIILSVLNGVVSEEDIGEVYGHEHTLYSVAQGMDAVKEGNHMRYRSMGIICFGEMDAVENSDKVSAVKDFFDRVAMPYEINNQMGLKLWSKLMANVGINQAVSYYEDVNRVVQQEGPAREMMVGAMKEVVAVANAEGISLSDEDVAYWLRVIDGLNPEGMPSMRQDFKARRYSEVELFAGTVVRLAEKHGLPVPVNKEFYRKFKEIEASY